MDFSNTVAKITANVIPTIDWIILAGTEASAPAKPYSIAAGLGAALCDLLSGYMNMLYQHF